MKLTCNQMVLLIILGIIVIGFIMHCSGGKKAMSGGAFGASHLEPTLSACGCGINKDDDDIYN